jgi:hypothetical protein
MIKRTESEIILRRTQKGPINRYSHNADKIIDPAMTKDRQIKPHATELPSSEVRSLAEIKQTLKAHMPKLVEHYRSSRFVSSALMSEGRLKAPAMSIS